MRPLKHLTASTALAGISYAASRDAGCAIACIMSGVLSDTDHLIEYWDYCRKYHQSWDWKEFSTGIYFNKKGTVKVIFHSWELATFLWIAFIMTSEDRKKNILRGIASGYTLHLILDQIGNNLNPFAYFETYRFIKRWNQEELIERGACIQEWKK